MGKENNRGKEEKRLNMKEKQFGKKQMITIANAGIAVFYMVYGYLCAKMLFRQSVGYDGKYISDLPAHINSGLTRTGYSLMEVILGDLVGYTGKYKLVGIFLALLMMATIFVTWKLLKMVAPKADPLLLHVGAILCNFAMALYLPMFNDYRYLGVQSGNIYHNSTYIGMKFLGMVMLYLYFSYESIYESGLSRQQWGRFAGVLILVNMIKPNFFVCFAPAMGIYLLIDLIRKKGKTFSQIFMFGLAVIPSVAVLLVEYKLLFPADSGAGGIVIDPGYCLFLRARTPVMAILQTMAFPLWMLVGHIKDLKKDRHFGFSWMILLISFLEYFFICEDGIRKDHGNLSWGYCYGIYVVFVISVAKLCTDLKERKWQEHRLYYSGAGLLLLGHVIYGLQYFSIMLQGGSFV